MSRNSPKKKSEHFLRKKVVAPKLYDPSIQKASASKEFVVNRIVGKKIKNGRTLYLVNWAGYDSDENTWEPVNNLSKCKNLLADYNKKHKTSKRKLSKSTDISESDDERPSKRIKKSRRSSTNSEKSKESKTNGKTDKKEEKKDPKKNDIATDDKNEHKSEKSSKKEDKEKTPKLSKRISFSVPIDDANKKKNEKIEYIIGSNPDKSQYLVKWHNPLLKEAWLNAKDIDKSLISQFEEAKTKKESNYVDFYYEGLIEDLNPTVERLSHQLTSFGLCYLPVAIDTQKVNLDKLYHNVDKRFNKLLEQIKAKPDCYKHLKKKAGFKELTYLTKAFTMPISQDEYPELNLNNAPWTNIIKNINKDLALKEIGFLILEEKHSEDFLRDIEPSLKDNNITSIKVLVPMMHFFEKTGCPEFIPKSHQMWDSVIPPVTMKALAGSAILFDPKLLYRFLPKLDNESGKRILLYLVYSTNEAKKNKLPSVYKAIKS